MVAPAGGVPAAFGQGIVVAPAASQTTLAITIPQGSAPGSMMQVQAPNGQMIQVMVPQGAFPGSVIQVAAPAPQPVVVKATVVGQG